MKVAIITANTAVYKGNEEDASGKVMKHMLEKDVQWGTARRKQQ